MYFNLYLCKLEPTLWHIWQGLPVRSCKGFELEPHPGLFTHLNTWILFKLKYWERFKIWLKTRHLPRKHAFAYTRLQIYGIECPKVVFARIWLKPKLLDFHLPQVSVTYIRHSFLVVVRMKVLFFSSSFFHSFGILRHGLYAMYMACRLKGKALWKSCSRCFFFAFSMVLWRGQHNRAYILHSLFFCILWGLETMAVRSNGGVRTT